MVNGSTHAVKKHDRDHDVQRRVREFQNQNFQDWTSCEMYGHNFVEDSQHCTDCGENRE